MINKRLEELKPAQITSMDEFFLGENIVSGIGWGFEEDGIRPATARVFKAITQKEFMRYLLERAKAHPEMVFTYAIKVEKDSRRPYVGTIIPYAKRLFPRR